MTPLARWRSLQHRHLEPEWMDAPDVDPQQLQQSLRFIRRINAALGYTRTTLKHLKLMTADWASDRPVSVLDVATGSADVPRAILRAWPERPVTVVGIDLHAATIRAAAAGPADARLRFVRGDATALPFDDRSFDFVLTGMFLHHLDEATTIAVLKEMNRVARHGLVIADLLRSRRAYAWIKLFTRMSNPMVRHDAAVSVAAAYTTAELTKLVRRAGIEGLTAKRHFGHRVVVSGPPTPAIDETLPT
jgi:ubiquinone/menaquinone biosynthesis C-methylase UbiE